MSQQQLNNGELKGSFRAKINAMFLAIFNAASGKADLVAGRLKTSQAPLYLPADAGFFGLGANVELKSALDILTARVKILEGVTGDSTAPSLSAVTVTDIGETSALIGVTADEDGTIIWAVYPAYNAVRSKADISAGNGAAWYGSGGFTPGDEKTSLAFGLTAGTAYKVHYYAQDTAGNQTAVAMTAQFTTAGAANNIVVTGPNALTGFGDSIMKGYWALQPVEENGFFAQVAAALGGVAYNHAIPSARVGIEKGENGGINFVDKFDTSPIAVNGYLLLNYGANDYVLDEGKENWKARYGAKIDYLIAQGFSPDKICLITVPYHPTTVSSYEFNSGAIVEIATELGVKCADIWTLMQPNYADYFSGEDYVHPNQAGHDFIFQKILETFGLTTEVPTDPEFTAPTKYASFDKVDDAINVSVPVTVPCTIEMKVRFNSDSNINGVMGSSSAGADFDFITNPGNYAPLIYTNNTDTSRTTSSGDEISPNEWHHVAIVFVNGFRIQYLNGVQVGMDDKTSQGFTLETLGYCVTQNFGTRFMGGDMAEVRVWSKALAEEEVQTARVTRYTAPQANILANWLMDGNANDVSGNNYHGTPAGGVTFV